MEKKKLLKSINSLEKQIEKHKEKLAIETKNYDFQDYWEKEIEQFEKQKEKLKKKL